MKVKLHACVYMTLYLLSNFFPLNTNDLSNQNVESSVLFWLTDGTALCDEEFCVSVRTRDFNQIVNFGFSLNWNPERLLYTQSNLIADTLLQGANFNETQVNMGNLGFSWQSPVQDGQGLSFNRDEEIINVCFQDMVIATTTVPIDFADQPIARTIQSAEDDGLAFESSDKRIQLECDEGCKAAFSFSVLDSCGSVQFFNESAGAGLSYNWNFGDGTVSQLENPAHTYNSIRPEGFQVRLEITSESDCSDNTTQTVIVMGQDDSPAEIVCPQDTAVDCTVALIPENTGELIVTDNCGINDIQITINDEVTTEATCSRVIKRTWVVVDKSDNISSCQQIISVIDQSGPEISDCPPGISVTNDPGDCGAVISIVPPTATDACNAVLSLTNDYTNNNSASDFYPVGTTVVTWSAIDDCGNVTANCSHSITVSDNEAPTIECMTTDTTITATPGAFGAIVEFEEPSFTDNCSANTMSSHQSGDFFPCGETIVTFNAVDEAGNTSESCIFIINVVCDNDIEFSPVTCGMAVTTRYSGDRSDNEPSDPVIEVVDIRSRDFAPVNQDVSDQFNITSDPRWTAFNLGEVFGLAIDDNDFIYASSTSIYPVNYFGANQENTGGEIYRINPLTGEVVLFQRLPNSGQGLGNLCFANHNGGRYLFVTNWENGFVYQIDLDDWNGNPDVRSNYEAFDIFQMDVDSLGYAPLGQLTWGIAYNPFDERLYFGRWMQNGGRLPAPNNCRSCDNENQTEGLGPNTIHSVPLDENGSLVLNDLRTDITLERVFQLTDLDTLISNPVSDIAFSTTGKMLITERTMCCPDEISGGRARVLEYEQQDNAWTIVPDKTIYIGTAGSNNANNSSGGIDYGYAGFNSNNPDLLPACDDLIWVTADINLYNTFGIAGIPGVGNNSTMPATYYINLSDSGSDAEQRMMGDIEILKCGCPIPSVAEFCDSVQVEFSGYGQPDSCCWSVDLINNWDEPNITRVEAEILTPGLIFNEIETQQGFVVNIANGRPNQMASIRFQGGVIPNGEFRDVVNFCFAGETDAVEQEVIFRWYEQIPGMEEQLVCTNRLISNCSGPFPDSLCLTVLSDSVYCDTLDYFAYEFQIRNELDRSITSLYLYPDSMDSNFSFEPSTINLVDPLPPNQTSELISVRILSDTSVTDTTQFAFSITAFDNDSDYYCNDLDSLELMLVPCCLSCKSSYVEIDEMQSDDVSCCYTLDVFNECPDSEYQKLELELLTPGAAFGSYYTGGDQLSEWSNPVATNRRVQWQYNTGSIPTGELDNLINFCLDSVGINALDSVALTVKWLDARDSLICVDSLRIDCLIPDNDCAAIMVDTLVHLGDGNFAYAVSFSNIASPSHPANLIDIFNISPDTVCISPIDADSICAPLTLPCSTDSGASCSQSFLITNAASGGTITFQLGLSDTTTMGDDALWRCFESDTFSIDLPHVPVMDCPGDITLFCCGAFDVPMPMVLDTTGNAQVQCIRSDDRDLTAPFTKGTTDITCIATNDFGQTDTCVYSVVVIDTLAPIVECPMIDTLFTDETCFGVNLPDYTSAVNIIDSCLTGITVIQSPDPGTLLDPGLYEIQISVVDACLNLGTCTIDLAVICDVDPPCDSLLVDYTRDTVVPDSCCYEIALTDIDDGFYPAVRIYTDVPTTITSLDPLNRWRITNSTDTDTFNLIPRVSPINDNDLGPIARICTDNFITEPHPVYLDWMSQGIDGELFPICTDTLLFDCDTTKCCQDEMIFLDRAEMVTVDYTLEECYAQVSWSGLGECDRIIWDWGDGTTSEFITLDSTLQHTFATEGPHNICYTIEETTRSGNTCWSSPTFCLPEMAACDSLLRTCEPCDENSITGPNLIENGNFEQDNLSGFESDYTFVLSGEILMGQYGIRNSFTLDNPQWAGIDHTTGQGSRRFLVVNGAQNINAAIWRDTVAVNPDRQHTFCAYVNNILLPELDLNDPEIVVRVNGTPIIAEAVISENPDLWILITGSWFSGPNDQRAVIEIFNQNTNGAGSGFAIDDISFYECTVDTCRADFEFELAFDNGNNNCGTVNFTNNSTALTNLTYAWDFGDGNTSTAEGPSHQYTSPGTYTACLTITSERNCTNTYCQEIIINYSDTPPSITCPDNVVISASTENCEAVYIPVEPTIGISLCSEGVEVECVRDDGLALTDPYPVGNTVITCTVTDNFGTSSCSYIITVTDENCPATCCINETNFDNRVQDGFTFVTENCELTVTPNNLNDCHRVVWDWGDDSRVTRTMGNMPVIHEYESSGSFEVCMQVVEVDDNGNSCFTSLENCMFIDVACDTTCTCGMFEGFVFGQDSTTIIQFTCGAMPQELPCPKQGQNFNLSGQFECMGRCEASSVNVQLIHENQVREIGDIGLENGNINAAIDEEFFKVPGDYILRLTAQCGDESCSCDFNFFIPEDCDCRCDDFQQLVLRQGESIFLPDCGDEPLGLNCPAEDINLRGLFACQGTSCDQPGAIEWMLQQPNGTLIANTVTAGNFEIDFSAGLLQEPGLYQLTLNSECGINGCSCTISWEQPDCDPCACPVETFDLQYQQDCNRVTFDFSNVETCDSVKIDFGNGMGEIVTGGQVIHHWYLEEDTFQVCYFVKRAGENGIEACTDSECFRVDINCLNPLSANTAQLVNGDFTERMAGFASSWTAGTDEGPRHNRQDGCEDPGYLFFQNNLETALLNTATQMDVSLFKDERYEITLCASPNRVYPLDNFTRLPKLQLVASKTALTSPDLMDCSSCEVIGTVPDLTSRNEWTKIRLDDWIPADDYSVVTLMLNSSDDTGLAQNYRINLDNIHINNLTTSSQSIALLEKVRIYPNPTNDLLNIDLGKQIDQPYRLSLFNTLGKRVMASTIGVGTDLQQVAVGKLPKGVYLLELLSEDRKKFYREKVVVQ